jgi:hypothetical protein
MSYVDDDVQPIPSEQTFVSGSAGQLTAPFPL